jgi:phospholipase/lecithinase/hemolysin
LLSASRLVFGFFLPLLLAQPEIFQQIRFKNVVTFGDSYTDTGNVFRVSHFTWPLSPPYFLGRFCNGFNRVDQLKVLGVDNYAYGSATTDNNFVQGYAKFSAIPIPGVRQQIATYFGRHNPNKIDFARTLYTLWAGGNDLIFNRSLTPPEIAASLLNGVQDLLDKGAQHIFVFNEVPAQYIPLSLTIAP